PRHFGVLSDAVRGAGRDVSLVLAAAFDPLDTPAKVANLRALLHWAADSGRRLELLRIDLAGLPAITDGASATAIGLSTSTRHLGLPLSGARRGEYQQRQRSPLVFVPRLLHWQRASTLGALSPWDGAGVTTCDCDACERANGD